jgi:cytochrome o ubiquinol oxidase subunit 3
MSEAESAAMTDVIVPGQETEQKSVFGFWVYIMTDCVLFASLFATYGVLHNNTFGGPSAAKLFSLHYVLVETLLLLTSSFTCGLAMLAVNHGHRGKMLGWFGVTFILGLSFLVMEISEFAKFDRMGDSWRRSGFLSSYFTLVGTHGLHITIGLLWMLVMMIRVSRKGLSQVNIRRLTMLSLFWHFLDLVWIFIYTIVYLMGAVVK